jgi:plasmid replication initiation protein
MTLQEKRLLLLAMAWIRQGDTDFQTYRVPITELCLLLDIKSKDAYSRLRDISRKLMSRVVEIEDDHGGWEMFQWVSNAKYVSRGKRGNKLGAAYLEIRFHKDMMPWLLELTRKFASIPFAQLASFRSLHALRLFEILYAECQTYTRKRLTFELDDLKKRLGVGQSYPNFADFERRVLQPAQKECIERSPLIFTYARYKTGRKVTKLTFTIKRNQAYQLELEFLPETIEVHRVQELNSPVRTQEVENEADALRAMEFYYDPYETIEKYGLELVRSTIRLAKKKQKEAAAGREPIHNLPGLVKSMLENGTAKRFVDEQFKKERKQTVRQAAEELTEAFSHARAQHADQVWENLQSVEQSRVKQLIWQEATPFLKSQLDRLGEEGILYKSKRRGVMISRGFLTFGEDLGDLEAFARNHPPFLKQPAELQSEILKLAATQD